MHGAAPPQHEPCSRGFFTLKKKSKFDGNEVDDMHVDRLTSRDLHIDIPIILRTGSADAGCMCAARVRKGGGGVAETASRMIKGRETGEG